MDIKIQFLKKAYQLMETAMAENGMLLTRYIAMCSAYDILLVLEMPEVELEKPDAVILGKLMQKAFDLRKELEPLIKQLVSPGV